MKIVNTGSTYQIYTDDLKTYDQLPVGVYKVGFNKFTGFFLEKHPDVTITEKLYGHHKEKVNKILDSFNKFDRNMGVIFSGAKGIGKSMAAKLMSQMAMGRGLPVILINEYLPGVSDLLNDIEQEVVVIFDEFDKTYSSGNRDNEGGCDKQTEFLTLLDGFGVGKKLYVVTCNSLYRLNDFLVNRPGRFHYHIVFSYPTDDEIREYLTDKLDKQYLREIDSVIAFSKRVDLNYDCLRAIAFELNTGISFAEAIKDLNIVNTDRGYEKFCAFLTLSDGSRISIKKYEMDSYDIDETSIAFDNGKYRVSLLFTPAEDLSYNLDRACSVVDINNLDSDSMRLWEYKKREDGSVYREEIDGNYKDWPVKIVDLSFKRIIDRKDTLHYMA